MREVLRLALSATLPRPLYSTGNRPIRLRPHTQYSPPHIAQTAATANLLSLQSETVSKLMLDSNAGDCMAILVAVKDDGPASEIETGAELAGAFAEKLVVLHVMSEKRFNRKKEKVPDFNAEVATDSAKKTAKERVNQTLDKDEAITVDSEGAVGKPARKILQVADEMDARYVVMGGRKRTPMGKGLFGSTSQAVLLDADRPIVTVMND